MGFYKFGLIHCLEQREELRNYYINCPGLGKKERPHNRHNLGSLYEGFRLRKREDRQRNNI